MERPILSVVIPTWNRAQMVCQAIDSAVGQGDGVEIIVVDDGSTDDTAHLLTRRFGSRINVLRLPMRSGAGAARNAVVRMARGELLAFLDSDDLWLSGKLDAELAVLERFPGAEVIVSDALTFQRGRPNDRSWFAINGLLESTDGRVRWMSECRWLWGHWKKTVAMCSITLRLSMLARLGQPLFAADLVAGEDWELEMRAYQKCRVAVLPEVWSHVRRINDGSRAGRACPGMPWTQAQEIGILRDSLKILERTMKLRGLAVDIVTELERCHLDTTVRLRGLRSG